MGTTDPPAGRSLGRCAAAPERFPGLGVNWAPGRLVRGGELPGQSREGGALRERPATFPVWVHVFSQTMFIVWGLCVLCVSFSSDFYVFTQCADDRMVFTVIAQTAPPWRNPCRSESMLAGCRVAWCFPVSVIIMFVTAQETYSGNCYPGRPRSHAGGAFASLV